MIIVPQANHGESIAYDPDGYHQVIQTCPEFYKSPRDLAFSGQGKRNPGQNYFLRFPSECGILVAKLVDITTYIHSEPFSAIDLRSK